MAIRRPTPASVPHTIDGGYDHHHRNVQGGAARAAVFGVSDGLVSNVSLILGVAGAHPTQGLVRIAGLAGLVGGAFSMAVGEYISMKAQGELLEREIEIERIEIERRPDKEQQELAGLYRSRGVAESTAAEMAAEMHRDPELALETHAREELGVHPGSLGSPTQAAGSSFGAFAVGALAPLVPWFFTRGTVAELLSVVIAAVAAVCVGVALSVFTGRSAVRSAVRQLLVTSVAAAVTFGIGHAVGVGAVA